MKITHALSWWTYGGAETAVANISSRSKHQHTVYARRVLSPSPDVPPTLDLVNEYSKGDIIHTHHVYQYRVHKWDGMPQVFTVHGYANDIIAAKRADAIVAVSDAVADYIASKGVAADAIIPPGIDFNLFSHHKTDRDHRIIDRLSLPYCPIILWVGRICPGKRVDMLAGVISSLPKYHFIVIGDDYLAGGMGDVPQYIKDAITRSKNTTWIPYVKHEDMPCFYRIANVTISTSAAEGYGLTIAESMACGTPCVVPNVPYLNRLVHDGESGYIVEPSVGGIVGGIENCLRRWTELLPLSVRSKLDKRVHDIGVVCAAYDEIYESLGE